ncbi:hypothetical protein EMCRGX_G010058 [Ephydatia muelleri]
MADFFECECMVRGNHKYKDIWEAEVGTTLQCQRETADPHDIYAIAVLKSGVIVGHGLKKISSTCSLFLQSGGAIHCTVTGAKCYSADLAQGGLEVPCVLKFVGDREKLKCLLDKTQKLACYALSKDQVHLKQQSVNPNEESKSVSESDSIPQTKKIKLSASYLTTKAPPGTSTEMPTFMPLGEAGVPLLQQSPQDPAIPMQLSRHWRRTWLNGFWISTSSRCPICSPMHGRRTLFRQATRYHRRAELSEEYRSRRSRSGWKVGLSPHLKVPRQGCQDAGHQSSIIRAARNYDGTAWVVYDRQLRREALARRDLNWSTTNAWLYSEAFTRRAKVIPCCRYCLSETHDLQACPVNPDNLDPTG